MKILKSQNVYRLSPLVYRLSIFPSLESPIWRPHSDNRGTMSSPKDVPCPETYTSYESYTNISITIYHYLYLYRVNSYMFSASQCLELKLALFTSDFEAATLHGLHLPAQIEPQAARAQKISWTKNELEKKRKKKRIQKKKKLCRKLCRKPEARSFECPKHSFHHVRSRSRSATSAADFSVEDQLPFVETCTTKADVFSFLAVEWLR